MSDAIDTAWRVYHQVNQYLQDPRLKQPASLGTVIPFLLLGIFSFTFSAIIAPPKPITAPLQAKAIPSTTGPPKAIVSKQTPETAIIPDTAEKADGEPAAEKTAENVTAPTPPTVARPNRSPSAGSPWRAELAALGLFAGWGWWAFAVILCAAYEVKLVFGSIAMLIFGVIMTLAVCDQL